MARSRTGTNDPIKSLISAARGHMGLSVSASVSAVSCPCAVAVVDHLRTHGVFCVLSLTLLKYKPEQSQ